MRGHLRSSYGQSRDGRRQGRIGLPAGRRETASRSRPVGGEHHRHRCPRAICHCPSARRGGPHCWFGQSASTQPVRGSRTMKGCQEWRHETKHLPTGPRGVGRPSHLAPYYGPSPGAAATSRVDGRRRPRSSASWVLRDVGKRPCCAAARDAEAHRRVRFGSVPGAPIIGPPQDSRWYARTNSARSAWGLGLDKVVLPLRAG